MSVIKLMVEHIQIMDIHAYGDDPIFKRRSLAGLRKLGKLLGLSSKDTKVWHNPGGPAVTGETMLMGMWEDGKGIYVEVQPDAFGGRQVMFRAITHMNDYTGGHNNFANIEELLDIETFMNGIHTLKERI